MRAFGFGNPIAGAPAASRILDKNASIKQFANIAQGGVRRTVGELGVLGGRQISRKCIQQAI